ncbi:uncharacterized protein ACLA_078150 [Aspergillus clavatus NRRL 1]|uniref:Uncharacterized protein n=1 Tax=Aspergillus clavatus (strain ATCC 1007 / CBS 513.65 / DSM 816 / NCTC 3887 / NRRL 1 / QM 1276 / 107) TaxID=344612 RepID=A1CLT8_ASPCL|nr:uncharacterized protein ACLA_078150 [Aspergillus clavatus NRRL 1]EAW09067.1 conserved hypothetical protein [Aspergillus clavatus NRRL 1]
MSKRKMELMSDPFVDESSELPELQAPDETQEQAPDAQEPRKKKKRSKKKKRGSQAGETDRPSLIAIMRDHFPSSFTDEQFTPDMFHRLTTISPRTGPHVNPNRQYPPAPMPFKHNDFLHSLPISEADLIEMQLFQSTYRLAIRDHDHASTLRLVWDYDRLWGCFDLGVWKGVMLIDPGPRDNTTSSYRFAWRGICEREPDVLFDKEDFAYGEISLGGPGPLYGFFKGMVCAGFADNQCDFKAERELGPAMVPWPVETFVADWNYLRYDKAQHAESARPILLVQPGTQVGGEADEEPASMVEEAGDHGAQLEEDREATTEVHPSSPVRQSPPTPQTSPPAAMSPSFSHPTPHPSARLTLGATTSTTPTRSGRRHGHGHGHGPDHDRFLEQVSGSYEISSPTMAHNWARRSQRLKMRLLVSRSDGCVWGMFNMGVYRGLVLFWDSPGRFQRGRRLKFCWRGREADARDVAENLGFLVFAEDMSLQGVFGDMYGDVAFTARRRNRPAFEPQFSAAFFRQQWWEYDPVPGGQMQMQLQLEGRLEGRLEAQSEQSEGQSPAV